MLLDLISKLFLSFFMGLGIEKYCWGMGAWAARGQRGKSTARLKLKNTTPNLYAVLEEKIS